MFDSRVGVVIALVFVLLVALAIPVLAVDYNPGVSVGDYVKLGNWYSIGVPPERFVDWEKIEVVAVSGKEVSWRVIGQMQNGSAIPDNGETYTINVETGATNFTHSFLGNIIAANLNERDKIQAGSISFEVNTTEIKTYLNVSRPVNVLIYELSGVGINGGPITSTSTFVYDKASGMMLENENRITRVNATNPDRIVYMSVTETNIFSPPSSPSNFSPYLYLTVAVASIALVTTGVVVFKKRKKSEAKTMAQDEKQIDLPYNLSGVSRGECYLADSLQHCLKVVSDLRTRGISALAIVREDPEFIVKNYNLKPDDVVLLSSKPIKGFKAVDGLQDISIAVLKFLKAGGGVVLLDGLEYLISRFGFNTVYMCLQEKKIEFLDTGAVLLVPVNMETLDSREKGQLLSELKLL